MVDHTGTNQALAVSLDMLLARLSQLEAQVAYLNTQRVSNPILQATVSENSPKPSRRKILKQVAALTAGLTATAAALNNPPEAHAGFRSGSANTNLSAVSSPGFVGAIATAIENAVINPPTTNATTKVGFLGLDGASDATIDLSNVVAGVYGYGTSGYGAILKSNTAAPLLLVPGVGVGTPAGVHTKGELYVDSSGALYYYDGTSWKQINAANVSTLNGLSGAVTLSGAGTASVNQVGNAITITGTGTNTTVNGLNGAITMVGAGSNTITQSGNTITFTGTGGSGAGATINGLSGAVSIEGAGGVTIVQQGNIIKITGTPAVSTINGLSGGLSFVVGNGLNLTTNTANSTITLTNTLPNVTGVKFLPTPIRVALKIADTEKLQSDGSGVPSAVFSQTIQVAGAPDLSPAPSLAIVPATAKGVFGSLTSIGASATGNLRLWPAGVAAPGVNSLNIPNLINLTTAFNVGLGTGSNAGKVTIAYANLVSGSSCGYALDVVGWYE